MTDYQSSIASITDRMASLQARFGMSLPVRTTGTASTSGEFDAIVDRLLSNPSSTSSKLDSSSLLSAILDQANANAATTASVPTAGATVTSVQSGASEAATDGRDIASLAMRYLDTPYVWGGEDTTGFDCSGLVQHVYAEAGYTLPRVAKDQATVGQAVNSLAEAKPGDLIAFGDPVDHIGIYLGNGKMIVAPHTGDVVKVQDVSRTPTAIRRIVGAIAPTGATGVTASPLATTDTAAAAAAPDAGSSANPAAAPYLSMFRAAEAKYGLPTGLLEAVAKQESRFDPTAVSPAGAQGLMQLMPATAAALGVDALDPAQAIDGSARLLSQHLRRFGSVPLALAAYNAGPGAVERYGNTVPPYRETKHYVDVIVADLADNAPTATGAIAGASGADTGAAGSATADPSSVAALRLGTPLRSDTGGSDLRVTLASASGRSAALQQAAGTPLQATGPAAATSVDPAAARLLTGVTVRNGVAVTSAAAPTVAPTVPAASTSDTTTGTTVTPAPTTTGTPFVPVKPTGTPVSPAAGAWGPNTQTQVTSVGGSNTVSWGEQGLLAVASPAEVAAQLPGVTGPVAKGVLKILRDATPAQLRSPEFRKTVNDVNRDCLGDPKAPDVIPVQPPAETAPTTTTTPSTTTPATTTTPSTTTTTTTTTTPATPTTPTTTTTTK